MKRVVCYANKTFGPSERFWDVREKELYAVIFGCETFHKYLAGSRFVVETDHGNLKWLMANHKNSGRLVRWDCNPVISKYDTVREGQTPTHCPDCREEVPAKFSQLSMSRVKNRYSICRSQTPSFKPCGCG